ncbi:MAG: hypothetical protein LBF54_04350, partial [Holosporaceae bacterium]|nr:hypothetical protein [Holosporaceae bacterium]
RLKTPRGLTPYESIVNSWKNNPHSFKINPSLPPQYGTIHVSIPKSRRAFRKSPAFAGDFFT